MLEEAAKMDAEPSQPRLQCVTVELQACEQVDRMMHIVGGVSLDLQLASTILSNDILNA
jgi:hypothetical protein